jgi:hypothetical protein
VFLNAEINTAHFSIHRNIGVVPQNKLFLRSFGIHFTHTSAINTTELNSQPNAKTIKAGLKCNNENTKYKSF